MLKLEGAQWIACPQAPADAPNYAPLFRRVFQVERPGKAVLTICGLGYHAVYINGRPVTDEKLVPAFTCYQKRVFVSEYEVSAWLRPGKNVLAVELGRGFYAMNTPNTWDHHKSVWHGEPRLICRLETEEAAVVSDEQFRTRPGPTLRCCLYTGETVDGARLEALDGWRTAEFDDGDWAAATPVSAPAGELVPAQGPPVRVLSTFAPASIREIEPGRQLIAFPHTISGWCRIRAQGEPGTTVCIRYGETLDEEAHIQLEQTFVEGELQTDRYIIGPSGQMDFEPQFSYKGFRYVEVIGHIAPLQPEAVTAKLVASAAEERGTFTCSDERIQWLYDATLRTVRNNLHTIPTDTPIYEKNGWTGDAGLMAGSMARMLDMEAFFDKWMTDMADCQLENGMLPLIVPSSGWGLSPSPEWVDCAFEIPMQCYLLGGNRDQLAKHYPTMKRLAEYELSVLDANGLPFSVLGDWIPPGHATGSCGPEGSAITAACYLIKSLRALAEAADVLSKEEEAVFYRRRAAEMTEALNRVHFDKESGTYRLPDGGFRQVISVLTLAFGIAPAEAADSLFRQLTDDIESKGFHLDTGILGTKYLLPLLSERGRHDLAWRLAVQDTYPSWGYWRACGADTLWEAWEQEARSRDHYMFGTVVDWLIGDLAGLRVTAPGMTRITVAPRPVRELAFCRWQMRTPLGELRIAWSMEGDDFALELVKPEGMDVTVQMPSGEVMERASGGRYTCRMG